MERAAAVHEGLPVARFDAMKARVGRGETWWLDVPGGGAEGLTTRGAVYRTYALYWLLPALPAASRAEADEVFRIRVASVAEQVTARLLLANVLELVIGVGVAALLRAPLGTAYLAGLAVVGIVSAHLALVHVSFGWTGLALLAAAAVVVTWRTLPRRWVRPRFSGWSVGGLGAAARVPRPRVADVRVEAARRLRRLGDLGHEGQGAVSARLGRPGALRGRRGRAGAPRLPAARAVARSGRVARDGRRSTRG